MLPMNATMANIHTTGHSIETINHSDFKLIIFPTLKPPKDIQAAEEEEGV